MPWKVIVVVISTTAFYTGLVNCDCERLPDVLYASNNATQFGKYREGAVLVFTCDENFSSLDNPFYVCKNGTFKGLFSCTKCNCYLPKISNNHILLYHKNCHISYACALGYVCHGQASLFCRPDGRWSPSQPPECRPVSCGDYGDIKNGKVVFESKLNHTLFGSSGRLECDDGFLLDGAKQFSCQADGTWSAKGSCKPFSCPKYPGIQSKCVEKTQIHSKNYYIKCREDVPTTDVGETTVPLKCQENGKWLNENRSCLCHCNVSELVKDKNIVVYGLGNEHLLKHGNALNWTCRNGTKKGIQEPVLCFDGRFNETVFCGSSIQPDISHNVIYILIAYVILIVIALVIGFIVWKWRRARKKGKGNTFRRRTGRERRETKHSSTGGEGLPFMDEGQTHQSRDDSDATSDRPIPCTSQDSGFFSMHKQSIQTNVDTGISEPCPPNLNKLANHNNGSKQLLSHPPAVQNIAEEDKPSEPSDTTVFENVKRIFKSDTDTKVIANCKNTNDASASDNVQQNIPGTSGAKTELDNEKGKEDQTNKSETVVNMAGNSNTSQKALNIINSNEQKVNNLPGEKGQDRKLNKSDTSVQAGETECKSKKHESQTQRPKAGDKANKAIKVPEQTNSNTNMPEGAYSCRQRQYRENDADTSRNETNRDAMVRQTIDERVSNDNLSTNGGCAIV